MSLISLRKAAFTTTTPNTTTGGSRHVLPAQISPNIYQNVQMLALRAHQALGCRGVSRADFRYDDRLEGMDGARLPRGQHAARHDGDVAGSGNGGLCAAWISGSWCGGWWRTRRAVARDRRSAVARRPLAAGGGCARASCCRASCAGRRASLQRRDWRLPRRFGLKALASLFAVATAIAGMVVGGHALDRRLGGHAPGRAWPSTRSRSPARARPPKSTSSTGSTSARSLAAHLRRRCGAGARRVAAVGQAGDAQEALSRHARGRDRRAHALRHLAARRASCR